MELILNNTGQDLGLEVDRLCTEQTNSENSHGLVPPLQSYFPKWNWQVPKLKKAT